MFVTGGADIDEPGVGCIALWSRGALVLAADW